MKTTEMVGLDRRDMTELKTKQNGACVLLSMLVVSCITFVFQGTELDLFLRARNHVEFMILCQLLLICVASHTWPVTSPHHSNRLLFRTDSLKNVNMLF